MQSLIILLGFFVLLVSFLYGMLVHKHRLFPYKLVRRLIGSNLVDESIPWSIGIYTGASPFHISSPDFIRNPVLTAESVTDRNAEFVADPFMVMENSTYYMLFEVLDKSTSRGVIGLAESKDGFEWKYRQIVIEEPFHLSYPYVFKWKNDFYLVPECRDDFSVRLYKATDFPLKWQHEQDLLRGHRFADPSLTRFQNTWWMFVSDTGSDVLDLFFSDDLIGPWHQHPMSPIIKLDKHISRPGGRLTIVDGKLYRFAQDDGAMYGLQVFAFEITEITKTSYRERLVSMSPVIKASGKGWNAHGMHTVDPHQIDDNRWIVVVDGR